jgi:hypothetical protein
MHQAGIVWYKKDIQDQVTIVEHSTSKFFTYP